MTPPERAAAALKTHFPHAFTEEDFPNYGDEALERIKDGAYRMAARAVLEAIREPSEGMIESIPLADKSFLAPVTAPRDFAVAGWRKMIDAALAEG